MQKLMDAMTSAYLKNIKGKLGLAMIYYTVHNVAMEANIAVKFIEGEKMQRVVLVSPEDLLPARRIGV